MYEMHCVSEDEHNLTTLCHSNVTHWVCKIVRATYYPSFRIWVNAVLEHWKERWVRAIAFQLNLFASEPLECELHQTRISCSKSSEANKLSCNQVARFHFHHSVALPPKPIFFCSIAPIRDGVKVTQQRGTTIARAELRHSGGRLSPAAQGSVELRNQKDQGGMPGDRGKGPG